MNEVLLETQHRFCGGFLFYVNMEKIKRRSTFVDRKGEYFITNEGYTVKIIEYKSAMDVSVMFEDGNIVNNIQYSNVKKGNVKNPYTKSLSGIGYLGDVGNLTKDNMYNTLYIKWKSMIRRCYDEVELLRYPSYINNSVDEQWLCFRNFYDWGITKYNLRYMKGWCLDKDILVKGNKVYGPDTCCFVPNKINVLFVKGNSKRGELPIGVSKENSRYKVSMKIDGKIKTISRKNTPEEAFEAYKIEKEKYIKEVADKWKDLIEPRVYEAMYNYKVEIDD